ncbi:MAG TPA: ferredoxin [Micromonosporaceae bacterium]|jgi:Fe-S-cluster-containing hydrogenase component 2|nr:ferredoxin [Micromonosporaceae bacterium]
MPFFIAGDCLDVLDRSCIEECPVDCIYEGDRKLYIHPRECIDCGACEVVCPVTAIVSDMSITDATRPWKDDNAAFFSEPLPGRDAPLRSPGGAAGLGRVGVDTPLAAGTPAAT